MAKKLFEVARQRGATHVVYTMDDGKIESQSFFSNEYGAANMKRLYDGLYSGTGIKVFSVTIDEFETIYKEAKCAERST